MPVKKTARKPLPPAPPAVPRQRAVELLAPAMRRAVDELLKHRGRRLHNATTADDADALTEIFETLRSNERQRFLYGQGRDYAGKIVTKAYDAAWSWHGYGAAIDIIHPRLMWDAPEIWWETLAQDAELFKLFPGRRFKSIPDSPHIQWRSSGATLMPLSPTAQDRADHRAGRIDAVWKRYGLL